MLNASTSLKHMRIIHAIFVLTIFLYAHAAEQQAWRNKMDYPAPLLAVTMSLAAFDGLIAYYFRRSKLFPALEKLRRDPNDLDALRQWRFFTLLSLALMLPIGLYGFALRFLGASRVVSWLFYLAALVLMLMWRPKLELTAQVSRAATNQ